MNKWIALLATVASLHALPVLADAQDRLEAFINATKTMKAQFTQTVLDRNGRKTQESSGELFFSRPGKFRWVYQKPYAQLLVGDGKRLWIYDEDLEQVTVRKLDQAIGESPAALLAGNNDIEKLFQLKDTGSKDGLAWLDASPKSKEGSFEKIRLGFKGEDLRVMELKDNFGQTTLLRLNNLERNPALNASLFRFTRPKALMSLATADLFGAAPPADPASSRLSTAPLAERLRPATLDQVIGQDHLIGPGKPLRLAFESGKPHSMILWGPPGVGKTTLARLMARHFDSDYIQISAVLAGVKEIREAVERAKVNQSMGRQTLLFVDEVHRFNKSQQDAFLPHVESGLITFIGATTENPSFEVVGALLSRAQVYVLKSLDEAALADLLTRALGFIGLETGELNIQPDAEARKQLLAQADGDGRRLLNLLDQLATAAQAAGRQEIDAAFVTAALAPSRRRFDKGGDAFYDQISALHKSVRGSSPDGALYWFTRMLDGGADPLYLGRRILRMAVEDIGLADPRALTLALDAVATYERLGSPEGELALAQAVLYLAVAPKSNAAYTAYNAARKFVLEAGSHPVPVHLRNAPTKLMKELGYGRAYRYAHDEPEAYAAGEHYFPDELNPAPQFYQPTPRGLEGKIGDRLSHLRELDLKARRGGA